LLESIAMIALLRLAWRRLRDDQDRARLAR